MASDGHSYLRVAFEGWRDRCLSLGKPFTSPLTSEVLQLRGITLRKIVCSYLETRRQQRRRKRSRRKLPQQQQQQQQQQEKGEVVCEREHD